MTALRHEDFLMELLSQPTVPYREAHVVTAVTRWLDDAGIPFFEDPVGNIVVGVADRRDYTALLRQQGAEPVRMFIAHMDHPGFHGTRWLAASRLKIKWYGGSPARYVAGSPVWLATAHGPVAAGELTRVRLTPSRRGIDTAEVRFKGEQLQRARAHGARALYGGFQFRAPVWRSGRRLYTKAADDLVGVFSICATAHGLYGGRRRRKTRPPFIGLLTRAEEVGFVGAIGHFELGWTAPARRPLVCVSLEASRTLPGAAIGKGPVVRLGDRRTVFDAQALKVLADVAQRVLPGRHQQRIMDGGTCEATAATVYGLPAVGISVPLGNYHNEGFEGGPDCRRKPGPAPEFVHLDDVQGQVRLCQGLMTPRLHWRTPWREQRTQLKKHYRSMRRLL